MTRIHIPIGAVEKLLGDGAAHGLHTARYAVHLANFYNKHRERHAEKLDLEKVFMFGAFHCMPYDPNKPIETVKEVFHGGFYEWRSLSQQYPTQKTLTMRLVHEAHTLDLLDRNEIDLDEAVKSIFTDRGKSIYERKHANVYKLKLA